MQIECWGGVGTVTGSKFLVTSGATSILIDCGLFQGYKSLRQRNWEEPPFDISALDAVILTHAHLDHSGYLPVLYERGYSGPVYCHKATRDLCEILLKDSGHIQEEDAKYYAKHRMGKHHPSRPLYTEKTAEASCKLFKPLAFDEALTVGTINFTLHPVGHILGAACVILETQNHRIAFSGDVGRSSDVLMPRPAPLPNVDTLFLESTYGNRAHQGETPRQQLEQIVKDTASAGGVLVVPCFAIGRAQLMQHLLADLKHNNQIPNLPVYLDSPMAINVSKVYCRHRSLHRLSDDQCHRLCNETQYLRSVEDSKSLAGQRYPYIVLAGSGMATGGRVLHHMKYLLPNHRNTVLFTGYQAGGTRGAKLVGGEKNVKIHGQTIPVHARIEMLPGLSGHADYHEIGDWLEASSVGENTQIHLIHGEADAADALRLYLEEAQYSRVSVAEYGQRIAI